MKRRFVRKLMRHAFQNILSGAIAGYASSTSLLLSDTIQAPRVA
jgi:hypothetical protein